MSRWRGPCVGLLLATVATLCAPAATPKRVLILDPFEREIAPYSAAVSALRTTLARELGEPVDFYEVPLDLARFSEAEGEGPLVTFLEGRLKNRPVDLVVLIGVAGAQFAARHRERIFPDTPVLLLGAQAQFVPPDFLRTNATLVTQNVNLPSMVEDILQLQPQTTNIVVVFGASPLERFWVNECRREFQPFTNRVGFTWLNDLSLEQILQRCAALPPRSFILHGLFVVDAAGVTCEKNEALRRLHQVANAPLFGYYASELGLGTIGGRLYQDSEHGVQGARTAIRILRGERPESIPPKTLEAAAPVFDWRELQRWGISEARLPAGSVIQFRQRGFWDLYRWPIAGTVLFCLLQAALIIGLLVNRSKRRQGEAEATLIADISSKFVNLPAADVDHQIENALRQVCELLGIDLAVLWQWSGAAPGIMMPTHAYCTQPNLRPSDPMRQDHYPWAVQQVLAGRMFAISSLEQFPAEAAVDRETCRRFGIKAGVCIPLLVGGETIGALGLNALRTERDWPEALVKRLQLVAQIFANALARKHADQALRESEQKYRELHQSMRDAFATVDMTGRIHDFNAAFQEMLGYSAEELRQMTYLDLTPDRWHKMEAGMLRDQVLTRGYSEVYEKEYRRKNGVEFPVELRSFLIRNQSGGPIAMGAIVRDLTERKQAQEALGRLQKQNELILNSAAEGILGLDLDGNHLFINPAAARMLGYEAEELLGRHSHSLWHHTRADGSPYPEEECRIYASYRDGQIHRESSEVFWRKDGTSFPVEYASTPIYEKGRLLGAVVTFEDITERKKTEDQLRQLSLAVEQSPVLVVITDLQGKIVYVNRKFSEVTGYSYAECIGQNPRMLKSGECPPSTYKELWARITSGSNWRGEFHNRKKNGELYWEWAVISPLLDAAGKVTHFVGIKEDITERKRAELETQELRDNLTHLTRVNTLGALSGSLAHELNQPLGIILSNAQAAQELVAQNPPDLAELQAILTDIVAADRRAGEVIERLRALLKRGQVSRKRLSLNGVIQEVLRLTQSDLIERGVTLVHELAPDLPPIEGDRVQLQQLTLNLILNGAEAMAANGPGTRRLHIATRLHQGTVRGLVRDEGSGLPADVERLFQPFYTTKSQGLGMGLAICRSIVAAHHGRLWAEPHPERGAIFHFELPVAGAGEQ